MKHSFYGQRSAGERNPMQVGELLEQIRNFQAELNAHRDLVDKSRTYPVDKATLDDQSRSLARMLGRLRPYLNRFRANWGMGPAGRTWDALEAAVGPAGIFKWYSFQHVIPALDQIIGQLEALNPEDDVPADASSPLHSGAPVDNVIHAYLSHLHPTIHGGCASLFRNGHYAQAVEDAAKAVSRHIQEKTGLSVDGSALAESAFSLKKPVLSFGDLSDESTRNEQLGFMELLKGFAIGVRNPRAHTHGWQDEPQLAFELLVVASLLCRRVDKAKLV